MPEVVAALDEERLALRAGEHIRGLRTRRGLSTRELAAQAGISQPFLSQIERGVSAPSMVTMYRLAAALGVLPGALLPATDDVVSVVRAGEGGRVPVSARPDAAIGRTLQMRSSSVLEVIEYVIAPGEHIAEWFELEGDLGVYVVSGSIAVEFDDGRMVELSARDFLAHPASLRHRWLLRGEAPAHVLLTIAHDRP